ncbi:MAG TPA: aldolase/citrate lyase family protein [Methyloversatilis sp.]
MSAAPVHPREVLYQGDKSFPILPAVDHYAGSEKLMRKALTLQADLGPVFDLTCDCEDGAAAGNEDAHVRLCASIVNSPENLHGRIGVRIHDVTHAHWRNDMEVLVGAAGARLAFITLPKARSADDVRTQIDLLRDCERHAGLSREIPVHVLIESHGALREVWDIAALDRVESIDLGLMDFVSAHHGALPGDAMRSPLQFEHPLIVRAKCEITAAALGCGVVPTHNVTTEIRDIEYIRSDATRARREFGFLRMWSIHPNQILPIVESMRPDFGEIEEAIAIICAAQDASWGPTRHNDTLHDRASYRYYWELLARAHATGAPIPGDVRSRFF